MKTETLEKLLNKTGNQEFMDELDLYAISAFYDATLTEEKEVDLDKFEEDARDYISQSVQVIFYHSAIDYLKNNDPSLRESLEIAAEFGFSLDKLNSEMLATMLLQRTIEEALGEFMSELREAETDEEEAA